MRRAFSAKSAGRSTSRTPRDGRTQGTRGGKATRRDRVRLGPSPEDLVIVSLALAELAEFLRVPQETSGRGQVILDRRVSERRRAARLVPQDRRQGDRRRPPANPTDALMRVLDFTVVCATRAPAAAAGPQRVKALGHRAGRARGSAPRPGRA
jgi:hypothetical protein